MTQLYIENQEVAPGRFHIRFNQREPLFYERGIFHP